MNNYYIYVYFDPTRGLEAFYVGKGTGIRSHRHLTRTDKHPFTRRIQKMAKQGVIPIIERYEDLTEEAALSLEKALIAEIGRKDLGKGTLLNLTDGGEGTSGRIHTDETKKKIGKKSKERTHSPEIIEKIKNGNTGKTRSDETRKRMSKSSLGKGKSAEHRLAMSLAQKNRRTKEKATSKEIRT